jgi:hypothetical protein
MFIVDEDHITMAVIMLTRRSHVQIEGPKYLRPICPILKLAMSTRSLESPPLGALDMEMDRGSTVSDRCLTSWRPRSPNVSVFSIVRRIIPSGPLSRSNILTDQGLEKAVVEITIEFSARPSRRISQKVGKGFGGEIGTKGTVA